MSVILLVLGILLTGIGVAATGFSIPINESAIGQTIIIAGATGIAGGLALIGFAAVVNQLTIIAEALKGRPPVRVPAPAEIKQPAPPPAEPRPEIRPVAEVRRKVEQPVLAEPRPPEPRQPEPRAPEPAANADVSASAIERLRSTMARPVVTDAEDVPLSPNGGGLNGGHHPYAEPPPRPVAPVDAKEPKLDFLYRGKAKRPQAESFDSMWPKRGEPGRSDEVARQAPAEAPPPYVEERRAPPPAAPPPPPQAEGRSVAILKSGVVDGMAYTLYADGSIEAQLPHGTVRFGSIAELRAHIENNS